jgi:hypothetical protein
MMQHAVPDKKGKMLAVTVTLMECVSFLFAIKTLFYFEQVDYVCIGMVFFVLFCSGLCAGSFIL